MSGEKLGLGTRVWRGVQAIHYGMETVTGKSAGIGPQSRIASGKAAIASFKEAVSGEDHGAKTAIGRRHFPLAEE